MNCARLALPLAFILLLSAHTRAQSKEDAQGKSSPTALPVTLSMDWSRGDAHYGPDVIQLRTPCQPLSEKSCECVADFKVISSTSIHKFAFGTCKRKMTRLSTFTLEGKLKCNQCV
jgi:hypothetical protein